MARRTRKAKRRRRDKVVKGEGKRKAKKRREE